MDSFLSSSAHGKQSDIDGQNIPVFDLAPGTDGRDIHTVAALDEITFAKNCTHNCKAAGKDNLVATETAEPASILKSGMEANRPAQAKASRNICRASSVTAPL